MRDIGAEWEYRSSFKRKNSRNETGDERKDEKPNESEEAGKVLFKMGHLVKQLQRAQEHLKKKIRKEKCGYGKRNKGKREIAANERYQQAKIVFRELTACL